MKSIEILERNDIEEIISDSLNAHLKEMENILVQKREMLNKQIGNINSIKEESNSLKDKHTKEIADLQLNYSNSLKEKEKIEDELNSLKDETTKQIADLQLNYSNSQKEKEKIEDELNSLKDETTKQIADLQLNYSKCLKEKEKIEDELNSLKDEKVLKLLRILLKNEALKSYKEKNDIKDESLKSLINLTKLLHSPKGFINSYLNDLREYKKENQTEMSDNEIEFYKAVNEYFGEDIIKDIYKIEKSEFDKMKHRGINGETRGEISADGIVLIPTHGDSKMRIKLKG